VATECCCSCLHCLFDTCKAHKFCITPDARLQRGGHRQQQACTAAAAVPLVRLWQQRPCFRRHLVCLHARGRSLVCLHFCRVEHRRSCCACQGDRCHVHSGLVLGRIVNSKGSLHTCSMSRRGFAAGAFPPMLLL
jgi:hypothetical protein